MHKCLVLDRIIYQGVDISNEIEHFINNGEYDMHLCSKAFNRRVSYGYNDTISA